jgi:hypothetical protein
MVRFGYLKEKKEDRKFELRVEGLEVSPAELQITFDGMELVVTHIQATRLGVDVSVRCHPPQGERAALAGLIHVSIPRLSLVRTIPWTALYVPPR